MTQFLNYFSLFSLVALFSCSATKTTYDSLNLRVHYIIYKQIRSQYTNESLGFKAHDTLVTINTYFLKSGDIIQVKGDTNVLFYEAGENYKLYRNNEYYYKLDTIETRLKRRKFEKLLYEIR